MSKSINLVFLMGHVGLLPEVRTTGSGTKVAKFSLATNKTWKDRNGQKQEKTEWHRITCWDKLAEIVEDHVRKGDRLHIEGSIEYSSTEDDNGTTRYWTDIVAREIVLLSGSGKDEGGHTSTHEPKKRGAPAPVGSPFDADDDLAF